MIMLRVPGDKHGDDLRAQIAFPNKAVRCDPSVAAIYRISAMAFTSWSRIPGRVGVVASDRRNFLVFCTSSIGHIL
jgi:hypothetical protein